MRRRPGPTRVVLGLSALIAAACLARAAEGVAPAPAACVAPAIPSKLDYLMLASLAESPHLLALSGYRPQWPAPGVRAVSEESVQLHEVQPLVLGIILRNAVVPA